MKTTVSYRFDRPGVRIKTRKTKSTSLERWKRLVKTLHTSTHDDAAILAYGRKEYRMGYGKHEREMVDFWDNHPNSPLVQSKAYAERVNETLKETEEKLREACSDRDKLAIELDSLKAKFHEVKTQRDSALHELTRNSCRPALPF